MTALILDGLKSIKLWIVTIWIALVFLLLCDNIIFVRPFLSEVRSHFPEWRKRGSGNRGTLYTVAPVFLDDVIP